MAALCPSLTLYDHVADLLALVEESELAAPETRPEYEAAIREQLSGTKDKIDRTNAALSQLEAVALHATEEIERLQKRKASALRNAERLKQYVLEVMLSAGWKKLEGHTSGFTLRSNAPGVEVVSLDAIPPAFTRLVETRQADKVAIKQAILGGVFVPGARLTQTLSLVRR